jgi:hypothetical protein
MVQYHLPGSPTAKGEAVADIHSNVVSKLDPQRFPNMSGFMMAIVGHILGEQFTTPELAEVCYVEAEDLVYFRREGEPGFSGMESLSDLRHNWNDLLDLSGLTPEERAYAEGLCASRIVPMTPEW